MRTISDHVYDLVQNSLRAGAREIYILIEEDTSRNLFKIIIQDDGHGIRPDQVSKIKDPFYTSRPTITRRVGLGLALMDATCERTGGALIIESKYRYGTTITATMDHDNIDRPPLGDLPDVASSMMISTTENKVLWKIEHIFNGNGYVLKNRKTSDELNIMSYAEPGVKDMLRQLIQKKEEAIGRASYDRFKS